MIVETINKLTATQTLSGKGVSAQALRRVEQMGFGFEKVGVEGDEIGPRNGNTWKVPTDWGCAINQSLTALGAFLVPNWMEFAAIDWDGLGLSVLPKSQWLHQIRLKIVEGRMKRWMKGCNQIVVMTSCHISQPTKPSYTHLHNQSTHILRLESITLVSSDAVDFVMAPTLRRDFATCWDAADLLIHGLVFWNAETQRFKFQGHSRQPQHARLGHGHQQGKGGEVVTIPASPCAVWIGNYLWCFNQTRARWQRNYLDQEYHHLCTGADAQKLCMYISIMYLYR